MDAAPDFEANTRTIRKWLNHETVSTERLLDELDYWREYWTGTVPTPAPGQIWGRSSGTGLQRETRHVRVEAFVPGTSLGDLVAFTWCGLSDSLGSPQIEHVETFLRRSVYSHGATT